MISRERRGFRISRKMVRIWKWVIWRRKSIHICLNSISFCSSSFESTSAAVRSKLIYWGKCLTRHLCQRKRACGGAAYRRLEDAEVEEEKKGAGFSKPPPKGHLTVCVGDEKDLVGGESKRYVVPVIYFNYPMFCELLHEAEEEFGYDHPGAITIPCPPARFERAAAAAAAHRRSLARS